MSETVIVPMAPNSWSQRMGIDLGYTLATIDQAFDLHALEQAASRITEVFHELVADPTTPRGDVAGCIPLRLVRRALAHQPRELFDAAVRWLDQLDEPPVEITYMDTPTGADIAEAVIVVVDGDVYLCNQFGLMVES